MLPPTVFCLGRLVHILGRNSTNRVYVKLNHLRLFSSNQRLFRAENIVRSTTNSNNAVAKQRIVAMNHRIGMATSATSAGTGPSGSQISTETSYSFNKKPKNDFKDEPLLTDQDILHEPERERFGVTKALVIIVMGVYFGAWIAMMGANMLEDLEIFVNDDDDDDD